MVSTLKRFFAVAVVAAVSFGVIVGCEPPGEEPHEHGSEMSAAEEGESGEEMGVEEGAESHQEQASPSSAKNDVLSAAASPFEDLTEFAEAGDDSGMQGSLTEASEHMENVREVVTEAATQRLESLISEMDNARQAGEYHTVALLSVEAYRVIVESLDDAALTVPKAVSLLDYSGFKVHAIAGGESPDWNVIGETVEEAAALWGSIEERVEEKGLNDAMTTAIEGMQQAVEARDALMVAFAAQVDLDLVDLLENYFESSAETN